MQLQHLIPAAFFSASAVAATFNGFSDAACQRYDGTYIPVTAAQLQDLVVQEWATADAVPEASRFLTTPDDKKKCPSNEDDTYKWVQIPQWEQGSQFPAGNGGAVAVVYYKDTDTYSLCRYLAAAQQDGYAGMCR